jgi:molybdopterin biosynthesis enzyme
VRIRSLTLLAPGLRPGEPPVCFTVPTAFSFEKKDKGMRQCLLGRLGQAPGDATVAVAQQKQGSAMLSTFAASTGFTMIAEERERIEPGDLVTFLPLDGLCG